MNKEMFGKGMSLLAEAFPERKFGLESYWIATNDLTDKEFLEAILEITMTTKEIYPGTNIIALIRSKAKHIENKPAAEAWNEVLSLIASVGSYNYPSKFSSVAVQKAVDGVGWREMCMSTKIGIERAHFYKIYDEYIEREEHEAIAPQTDVLQLFSKGIGKSIEGAKE